jgi:hypothetical protein
MVSFKRAIEPYAIALGELGHPDAVPALVRSYGSAMAMTEASIRGLIWKRSPRKRRVSHTTPDRDPR